MKLEKRDGKIDYICALWVFMVKTKGSFFTVSFLRAADNWNLKSRPFLLKIWLQGIQNFNKFCGFCTELNSESFLTHRFFLLIFVCLLSGVRWEISKFECRMWTGNKYCFDVRSVGVWIVLVCVFDDFWASIWCQFSVDILLCSIV